MHSNLPPGVNEGMLPGNRPEDMAWEEAMEFINEKAIEGQLRPDQLVRAFALGAAQLTLADAVDAPKWKTIKHSFWFASLIPDYQYGIVLIENESGEHKAYLGKAEGKNLLVDQELILAQAGAPVTLHQLRPIVEWLETKAPVHEEPYPEGGDPGEIISEDKPCTFTWEESIDPRCDDVTIWESKGWADPPFKILSTHDGQCRLWQDATWLGNFPDVETAKEEAEVIDMRQKRLAKGKGKK